MRLLLMKNLKKLGKVGDIVAVKDGYGRNFLLPSGNAVAVTQENIRLVSVEREKALLVEAQQREDATQLSLQLGESALTISMKASEEGHLYGSVNAQLVAETLAKAGIQVDEKNIRMDPVKELGEYTVRIHVRDDQEEDIKILVVADDGDSAASSNDASEG